MVRDLPHLFHHWEEIVNKVRASQRILVFLDFDGTLVRIAPRPDLVHVEPETRRILQRLAEHPRVSLAIVSGRRRGELQRYLKQARLEYFGLYGWERNGHITMSSDVLDELTRAHEFLSRKLASFPGVWIEHKGISLSVHLKAVAPATQRVVRKSLRRLLPPFSRGLHFFENLRDIEILPRSILDKGAAVRDLLAKQQGNSVLPFYAGDDFSDESAFVAVQEGLPVLVGKRRRTQARFRLRGPAELTEALSRLAEILT